MQGKLSTDEFLFNPKIAKIEQKNMKKKKQATTKPSGEFSSIDSPSPEKPLVIDSMARRGGEGNIPATLYLFFESKPYPGDSDNHWLQWS